MPLTVADHRADRRDRAAAAGRSWRATSGSATCWGWRGGRSTLAAEGWEKVAYRRGDILDRGSLAALFDGADVAVHLAFAIFGAREQTRRINLEGIRNVFEAAIAAGCQAARLRLLGRRLRLPPRQPAAADRGGPGARQRWLLLLGPEGRAGGDAGASSRRQRGRRLRLPALRRRRAAGDDADRAGRRRARLGDPLPALRRGLGRLPLVRAAAARRRRCRSSSSTTTTSPGRWPRRSPARGRPAPTTSPARAGSAVGDDRPRDRLALGPGPERRRVGLGAGLGQAPRLRLTAARVGRRAWRRRS